jgi:hypothetical protein
VCAARRRRRRSGTRRRWCESECGRECCAASSRRCASQPQLESAAAAGQERSERHGARRAVPRRARGGRGVTLPRRHGQQGSRRATAAMRLACAQLARARRQQHLSCSAASTLPLASAPRTRSLARAHTSESVEQPLMVSTRMLASGDSGDRRDSRDVSTVTFASPGWRPSGQQLQLSPSP